MFTWLPHWLRCGRTQAHGLVVFAVYGLVIAAAAITDDAGRAALGLVPDRIAEGEVWRILTGHFVHLSRMHAFMNELGLLFLIVVLWDVLEPVTLVVATVFAAIAIGIGMMLTEVAWYVGFSGVTHGLFAWGGLRVWQSVNRGYGALILATVLGKLLWEATQGPTPGATEAVGGVILVESHLYGVIGGIAAALVRPRQSMGAVLALVLVALPGTPAEAHSLEDSTARLRIEGADLLVTLDIESAAFILREPPGALSDAASARVSRMPEADLQDYVNGAGDFLLNTVQFIGAQGGVVEARRIRMPSPAALRRHATTPDQTDSAAQALLMVFDAEAVRALQQPRLRLPPMVGPVFLVLHRADDTESVNMLPPGVPSQPLDFAATRGFWDEIGTTVIDGILHVVPSGWDHALFMALLVLATPLLGRTLLHATIFTLAHSITLFLAGFGLVNLPGGLVEFGIALTVALAGIETTLRLRRGRLAPAGGTRVAIIFVFGLLHGLGFATVFSALAVGQSSLVTALLGFNIGVEIGQIMVIFAVFALLALLRRIGSDRVAARSRLAMSAAIAVIGAVWVIERAGSLMG